MCRETTQLGPGWWSLLIFLLLQNCDLAKSASLCDPSVDVEGALRQCTVSVIKLLFGKEYEGPEIPGSFQGVKPIDGVCM